MRNYKAEVYLHLVWATQGRQPLLTPDIERRALRCIEAEAKRLGCVVLAIGSMPDHVHLAVRMPTTASIARLMKQVKGVSSAFINDSQNHTQHFRWQGGYGVFSISRPHLARVISYVQDQKKRHAARTTWEDWEPSDAAAEAAPAPEK